MSWTYFQINHHVQTSGSIVVCHYGSYIEKLQESRLNVDSSDCDL